MRLSNMAMMVTGHITLFLAKDVESGNGQQWKTQMMWLHRVMHESGK